MLQIAVIPGDGIGPEVMAQALPLLTWAQSRGRAPDSALTDLDDRWRRDEGF